MRKLFSLLLVLGLILSGCGSNDSTSNENKEKDETTEKKDISSLEQENSNKEIWDFLSDKNAYYRVNFLNSDASKESDYYDFDGNAYPDTEQDSKTIKPNDESFDVDTIAVYMNSNVWYVEAKFNNKGSITSFQFDNYSKNKEYYEYSSKKGSSSNDTKANNKFYLFLMEIGTNEDGFIDYLEWVYDNKAQTAINTEKQHNQAYNDKSEDSKSNSGESSDNSNSDNNSNNNSNTTNQSNNTSNTNNSNSGSAGGGNNSSSSPGTSLANQNAVDKARSYLSTSMAFSYQGLVDQLIFEGFTAEEAAYGASNVGANWDEQALKSAKNYLATSMAFSYQGLKDQLLFEGFTDSQASYGVNNCGANWNEQAAKSAKSYLSFMSFSRQGLIDQLIFEGFTQDQAVYGVNAAGL